MPELASLDSYHLPALVFQPVPSPVNPNLQYSLPAIDTSKLARAQAMAGIAGALANLPQTLAKDYQQGRAIHTDNLARDAMEKQLQSGDLEGMKVSVGPGGTTVGMGDKEDSVLMGYKRAIAKANAEKAAAGPAFYKNVVGAIRGTNGMPAMQDDDPNNPAMPSGPTADTPTVNNPPGTHVSDVDLPLRYAFDPDSGAFSTKGSTFGGKQDALAFDAKTKSYADNGMFGTGGSSVLVADPAAPEATGLPKGYRYSTPKDIADLRKNPNDPRFIDNPEPYAAFPKAMFDSGAVAPGDPVQMRATGPDGVERWTTAVARDIGPRGTLKSKRGFDASPGVFQQLGVGSDDPVDIFFPNAPAAQKVIADTSKVPARPSDLSLMGAPDEGGANFDPATIRTFKVPGGRTTLLDPSAPAPKGGVLIKTPPEMLQGLRVQPADGGPELPARPALLPAAAPGQPRVMPAIPVVQPAAGVPTAPAAAPGLPAGTVVPPPAQQLSEAQPGHFVDKTTGYAYVRQPNGDYLMVEPSGKTTRLPGRHIDDTTGMVFNTSDEARAAGMDPSSFRLMTDGRIKASKFTAKAQGMEFPNAEAAKAAGYDPTGADILDNTGRIRITKIAKADKPDGRTIQQLIQYGVDPSGKTRDEALSALHEKQIALTDLTPVQQKAWDGIRQKMAVNPVIKVGGIRAVGYGNVLAGHELQNGAGDMMMIEGFARMLNPTVGVSGQMVSNFKDALPLVEKWSLTNSGLAWNKIWDGAKLTPGGRDMFLAAANSGHANETAKIREAINSYAEDAKAHGLPFDSLQRAAYSAYLVAPEGAEQPGAAPVPGAAPAAAPGGMIVKATAQDSLALQWLNSEGAKPENAANAAKVRARLKLVGLLQ